MHKIIRLSSLLFCLALFSHCNSYQFQHPNNMDRSNNPHQLLSDLLYTNVLEDAFYVQAKVRGVKALGNFSLSFLWDSINRLVRLEAMIYCNFNEIKDKRALMKTLEVAMKEKDYLPNLFLENEELKKIILLNFYRQYLFVKKDIKRLDKLFEENPFLVNFPTHGGLPPIAHTLLAQGSEELRDYLLNHKDTRFEYLFYGIKTESFTTLMLKRNYILMKEHGNSCCLEFCPLERLSVSNYPNLLLEYPLLNPSLRGKSNFSSPLLAILLKLNDLTYDKWDSLIRILLSQADKNVFNDIFEGLLRTKVITDSSIEMHEIFRKNNPAQLNFYIGELLSQFYKHNKETKRTKAILQNVLRKKGHNKKIISLVKKYAGLREFKLDPKRVLKVQDKLFTHLIPVRNCQLLLTANTICACCKKSEKELAKSSPNSEIELLRCSKCKCAYYCSKKCQRKHWFKHHKKKCISIEKIRELRKNKQICQNCLILNKKDYVNCEHCKAPGWFKVVVPTSKYKEACSYR